jgi:hypothetical protein
MMCVAVLMATGRGWFALILLAIILGAGASGSPSERAAECEAIDLPNAQAISVTVAMIHYDREVL